MTLVQYEYIVAVDNNRHFATAAEKCFVTQPTLSMQIHKLEEQLGVQIFDRSRQPVVPTSIGAAVIAQARVALREAEKIQDLIDEQLGVMSGELSIGIIPTLSPYLVPLFINEFANKYPDLALVIDELITEKITEQLLKNQLDIGIFATPSGTAGLTENPIFQEEFVAYLGDDHPLKEVTAIDPYLLEADDVWVINEGHCFRSQVLNICQPKSDSQRHLTFQSGSLESLKRLVDHHGGMTLLPELATFALSNDDKKRLKRFKDPIPAREISLVTHQSFVKRRLTDALADSIKANLPADLSKEKATTLIPWN